MALELRRFVLSRQEGVYQAFPDVAQCVSGRLVAVWRASAGHTARDFSDIVLMHSDDGGETWHQRRVLDAGPRIPWEDGRQPPAGWWSYNCPRVTILPDGRLVAVCDRLPRQGEGDGGDALATNWMWLSNDDGLTWLGPSDMGVRGIVPDRIRVLSDGTWICGTHWTVSSPRPHLAQFLWRSSDEGRSWQGPVTVADVPDLQLCEGCFLETPDGTIVCTMRENSATGLPGFKAFSADGGMTWEGPYETLLFGCHRPVSGLLASGKVLTTYRCYPGYGMTRLFFACLEPLESLLARERARQSGRLLALDHDRNRHVDIGYSGWVQLPDGRVLVVYYIKDDASVGQIRGCWLTEADFVLDD